VFFVVSEFEIWGNDVNITKRNFYLAGRENYKASEALCFISVLEGWDESKWCAWNGAVSDRHLLYICIFVTSQERNLLNFHLSLRLLSKDCSNHSFETRLCGLTWNLADSRLQPGQVEEKIWKEKTWCDPACWHGKTQSKTRLQPVDFCFFY